VEPKRKVKLSLVGLNSNAEYLLGAFARQARREKWTFVQIAAVIKDAKSGDYDHLLRVLMAHSHDGEDEE
jgi:hypothetical protein